MGNITTNGHGATAVAAVKGSGIANRHADKRQLAALAAAILAGDTGFKPSLRQLAQLFGVSVTYIGIAQRLSAAERAVIIDGVVTVDFAALLNGPKLPSALPAPTIVTNEALEALIRDVGVERVLTAAVAVETHATH